MSSELLTPRELRLFRQWSSKTLATFFPGQPWHVQRVGEVGMISPTFLAGQNRVLGTFIALTPDVASLPEAEDGYLDLSGSYVGYGIANPRKEIVTGFCTGEAFPYICMLTLVMSYGGVSVQRPVGYSANKGACLLGRPDGVEMIHPFSYRWDEADVTLPSRDESAMVALVLISVLSEFVTLPEWPQYLEFYKDLLRSIVKPDDDDDGEEEYDDDDERGSYH